MTNTETKPLHLWELDGHVIELTVYVSDRNSVDLLHHHTYHGRVKEINGHTWIGGACFASVTEVNPDEEPNAYRITFRV